ncbi:MAG TPA: CBS domain-containing protein [Vicinamibacterales bacterium]|jgi:CBS domain-containing protein|nr:CBS domain-containing protein [Vicinamibacterales bacterium]
MTSVRQMLRNKTDVFAVSPDDTVYDALMLMADRNIGAVLVMEGGELRGILTERDYARKGIVQGRASKDTVVAEIMTPRIICVAPGVTADECMVLMTDQRVRHLPVMEAGRVVGVVSIGDVVRAILDEQRSTIDSLQSFIRTA